MDDGDAQPRDDPSATAAPEDVASPTVEEQENRPTAGAASGDGGGPADDGSSDALAKAIASVLGGVIREFDAKAEAAAKSQDVLALSFDRLTTELDKLLEDAPLPFIMQHAARISGIRKRVFALNSVLRSIQRRIDNIDMMISAGLSNEKAASEFTEQPEN